MKSAARLSLFSLLLGLFTLALSCALPILVGAQDVAALTGVVTDSSALSCLRWP